MKQIEESKKEHLKHIQMQTQIEIPEKCFNIRNHNTYVKYLKEKAKEKN